MMVRKTHPTKTVSPGLTTYFQEFTMPYVNIRIAGTLSREQKARIAAEITDTLERIALKPKSYTYIAFDELPDENWAIAGQLLDED
jgi:4-oxalocrotonate tautomerase